MRKVKVAVIGTHGIPAKYGGFETLAEVLCLHLQQRVRFTVYCNAGLYAEKPKYYNGARLRYIPLNASGFQGVLYDVLTFIHALFTANIVLFLSPVGSGSILPLKVFFGKKVIVNHGGLNEWERPKLSWFAKKWARLNHFVAGRFADVNVVDNQAYRRSLKQAFGVDSVVIKYGADHVRGVSRNDERFSARYSFLPEKYAISVSRAQVDNNLHMVLEAFRNFGSFPLVLVSNWEVSEYGRKLKEEFADCGNVFLLDAIYNTDELNYLRSNACCYVHSHSFCGTAPSLIEAMCLGKAVLAFDVVTNRETTKGNAFFFGTSSELLQLLKSLREEDFVENGKEMLHIAEKEYRWSVIAEAYFDLFNRKLKSGN